MTTVKRYRTDRNFLSLLGMIGFLLFAIQLNYQYTEPGEATDANDPVSISAQVVCAVRGMEGEHLPVVAEAPVAGTNPSPYHCIPLYTGPSLRASEGAHPSLRGPPFCV